MNLLVLRRSLSAVRCARWLCRLILSSQGVLENNDVPAFWSSPFYVTLLQMKRMRPIVYGLSVLLAASLSQTQVNSQNASQTSSSVLVDRGKIRFYNTKIIQGEETYQI